MRKLLFIITKSEMGGAQRFLYELVTHLDVQKYDILVAAGGHGELFEKLESSGIKSARIRHFSNIPGIKNLLAFLEILRAIIKAKPDILYLLSSEAGFTGSLAGKFYRLIFWRKKPKIIYRIGGWAFKEPRNFILKMVYLWAEKISAPFKDIIVVNSEFDARLGIKHHIATREKIITIYNGLDFEKIKFLPRETARQLLLRTKASVSAPLIGTIANLYKNKGLEYLIEAMSKIKGQISNVMLLIIGEGPEREKLEKLIEKYELENTVHLAGSIPDAFQFLKAFDLFVLPSVKEGQPWAVLEAMAAARPIVATNIAGIAEMIENEKTGLLVEPTDPAYLAEAIEKMMTHPSLAHECAQNALEIVKDKFDVAEMVKKNEELFL